VFSFRLTSCDLIITTAGLVTARPQKILGVPGRSPTNSLLVLVGAKSMKSECDFIVYSLHKYSQRIVSVEVILIPDWPCSAWSVVLGDEHSSRELFINGIDSESPDLDDCGSQTCR